MATDLTRIGDKARSEPELVFTSLYHHVYDVDNLRACYDALPANKAAGIDRVTKQAYGLRLEANLQDLSARLRRAGYRPSPKRRSYIPKEGSEKGRPLGISTFERALCTGRCAQARRQTGRVHVPRLHALLRDDAGRLLQTQTAYVTKEAVQEPAGVHRLGAESTVLDDEGRDAPQSLSEGRRTSGLLRDH